MHPYKLREGSEQIMELEKRNSEGKQVCCIFEIEQYLCIIWTKGSGDFNVLEGFLT